MSICLHVSNNDGVMSVLISFYIPIAYINILRVVSSQNYSTAAAVSSPIVATRVITETCYRRHQS